MFVDFNILNQLGSPSINSNTFANRPAAGQTGRLFVSTDTFEIYRDNGTTWDLIGGPGSSTITGTGTATQVAYFTSSQAIGSSSNFFWDATNNRLGLGTQTPAARLDIHSAADVGLQLNGTGASPSILQEFLSAGVAEYDLGYVWNADVNYQRFRINDVSGAKEVLTIDKQSRFVGINYQYSSLTDQPAYTLDVSGSARITDSVYLATAANNRVGIGTTSPQYPLDVVVPNTNAVAIVTTRENANGPSYFVGRCIGGTYASPTDQVTFGAILHSYGYRSGNYREHGYLTFSGVNASSGNGILGYWQLFLTNDSSVITQIAQASANSFNIGGDYLQTTYKLKVTGQSAFSAGFGQLGVLVNNTTSAASGVTGYGLLISSEASASTSYALHLIDSTGSVSYGGVSTASGQVGYWSIGFAATGTIGNRLTVSGAFSVGSGSYLTTAAPSNGAMIQGNVLIGTTTDVGGTSKLQVAGNVYLNAAGGGDGLRYVLNNTTASEFQYVIVNGGSSADSFQRLSLRNGTYGTNLFQLNDVGTAFLQEIKAGKSSILNTTAAENGTGGGNRQFDLSFTPSGTNGFNGTDNGDQGYGYFPVTITSGKTYEIKVTMATTNGAPLVIISSTTKNFATSTVDTIESAPLNGTTYHQFTATGNAAYIGFGFSRSGGTLDATVSNFSIVEINGVLVTNTETVTINGKIETTGTIKTGAPTTGTAAEWKLGQRVAAAVVLDATQYIQVEVGGTFYKLAIVT